MPTYNIDYWVRFYNGTITIEAENEREALEKIDLEVLDLSSDSAGFLGKCLDVEWDINDIREV